MPQDARGLGAAKDASYFTDSDEQLGWWYGNHEATDGASAFHGVWRFDDYYTPIDPAAGPTSIIGSARLIVKDSSIANHPFFGFTRTHRAALVEWAKQECVVTNHFSFALLSLLAKIKNVHLRSLLIPIVVGEHSPVRDGYAYHSHPHLLSKLVIDLGVSTNEISPLPFTEHFIDILFCANESVAYSIGVLGVGNEALLVPEYGAVEEAFSPHFHSAIYRPFLRANVEEESGYTAP